MRPPLRAGPCLACTAWDEWADRNARLIVHLRHLTAELHQRRGHPGHWIDCLREPCQDIRHAIEAGAAG